MLTRNDSQMVEENMTNVRRRRRWTLGQKVRAVEEAAAPGMTVSFVAREHGIAPSLLFRWRRLIGEGGYEAIRQDDEVLSSAEVRDLKRRIRELERLLGKKTLENETLREALEIAKSNSHAGPFRSKRMRQEDDL